MTLVIAAYLPEIGIGLMVADGRCVSQPWWPARGRCEHSGGKILSEDCSKIWSSPYGAAAVGVASLGYGEDFIDEWGAEKTARGRLGSYGKLRKKHHEDSMRGWNGEPGPKDFLENVLCAITLEDGMGLYAWPGELGDGSGFEGDGRKGKVFRGSDKRGMPYGIAAIGCGVEHFRRDEYPPENLPSGSAYDALASLLGLGEEAAGRCYGVNDRFTVAVLSPAEGVKLMPAAEALEYVREIDRGNRP